MVKLAILGTGFIANILMKVIHEIEDVEVCAVLAVNDEDAESFASSYGIPKRYTDYDKLLDDGEIEFVDVALPNHLHYEYPKKALDKGKNAIVEKPFVSSEEEVEELIAVAKANKRMLFDATITKYIPTLDSMKKNLHRVGEIKHVTTSYCQYSSRFNAVREGNIPGLFTLEHDGGALKYLGIYPINFIVALFGKPDLIRYYANKLENGCDSSGVLIMQYKTFITTSLIAKDSFTENRCTVEGYDGTLFVDDDCFRFPNLRFKKRAGDESEQIDRLQVNGLANEFNCFMRMYKDRDFEACYYNLEKTKVVIEVLKTAAESAGLVYG